VRLSFLLSPDDAAHYRLIVRKPAGRWPDRCEPKARRCDSPATLNRPLSRNANTRTRTRNAHTRASPSQRDRSNTALRRRATGVQIRSEPRGPHVPPPPSCDARARLGVSFLCLRASVALTPVAAVSRGLMLASGTLSPFDLLAMELGLSRCGCDATDPTVTPLAVAEVSCAHLGGLEQRLLPVYMSQRDGVPLSAT
jgi:hypothetical protein